MRNILNIWDKFNAHLLSLLQLFHCYEDMGLCNSCMKLMPVKQYAWKMVGYLKEVNWVGSYTTI